MLNRSPCLWLDSTVPGGGRARGLSEAHAVLSEQVLPGRGSTRTLNVSESLVHQFISQHKLTTTQIDGFLSFVHNSSVVASDIVFHTAVRCKTRVFSTLANSLQTKLLYESSSDWQMDGTNNMTMWFRPVMDILALMVSAPKYACHMDWSFSRTVDPASGHRLYTKLTDCMWFEGVTAHIQCTMGSQIHVVPVVAGSDGTQIRKRAGAHPVYISIGSLHGDQRRRTDSWILAGFVPKLDAEKMGTGQDGKAFQLWEVNRRRRQIHNAAVFEILSGLIAHYEGGGVTLLCGDGVVRRLLFVFAQYITDRQEHETLLFAKAHSCFHCVCDAQLRWQRSGCTWPTAQPKHGQRMKEDAQVARDTG